MPTDFPKVTLEERARRYVAAMPPAISGSGGHNALFNVVRALLHGFGFTPAEAQPYIDDYNQRCDPPWSEGEIAHKLRSVDTLNSKWPRGYLRNEGDWKPSPQQRHDLGIPTEAEVRAKIDYDLEKLQRVAKPWRDKADLLFLANRSRFDPATVTAAAYLQQLYGPKEKVLCFTNEYSQGEAIWPDEEPPMHGRCGVWYLPQPVTGTYMPNPEGRPRNPGEDPPPSRRIGRCVTAWRYLVLESDTAPLRDWLGFIVQAPLQIEAIYTSGVRSIHTLVRVDAKTYEDWHAKRQQLMPFLVACMMMGLDKNTSQTGVRLSRLPGCMRYGKMVDAKDGAGKPILGPNNRPQKRYVKFDPPGEQKLLYFRPGADTRPICERPPERDVEHFWTTTSRMVMDGFEENTAATRNALRFYSSRSAACAAAFRDLDDARSGSRA